MSDKEWKTCISPLATRAVLYTDTVGGQQTCRDDLWAVTTDELNDLHKAVQQAKIIADIQAARIKRLEGQMNEFRPDFLVNGTRFKLNFSARGNVDVFASHVRELQGRWVALVPADDDMHLARATSDPSQVHYWMGRATRAEEAYVHAKNEAGKES